MQFRVAGSRARTRVSPAQAGDGISAEASDSPKKLNTPCDLDKSDKKLGLDASTLSAARFVVKQNYCLITVLKALAQNGWAVILSRRRRKISLRWSSLLITAFCLVSFNVCGAQPSIDNTFALSVVAPTKAADVQVRYVLTGDNVGTGHSMAAPTGDNKILIQTTVEGKQAKGLKLIAYAPGCQFVTIRVDDFASSGRQGTFACTPISTVQFHGRANVTGVSEKALDAQALYSCDWASQFFGKEIVLSPFSLGKTEIASNGFFIFDVPDFTADPLWPSLSNHARLIFVAIDAKTGQTVASLKAAGASKESALQVAERYPEVEFTIQSAVRAAR